MNDTTTTSECDQSEEEALNLFTYEVSDEALEAASGAAAGGYTRSSILVPRCCTERMCR
jgi:hypothetical protein